MLSQYVSEKIKLISFFLIIWVLLVHSGFRPVEIDGMSFNYFVQEFLSDSKLGRVIVPLFFIISGYLFFMNTDKGFNEIKRKIRSRINTLFIPYLFGCSFFFLFIAAIQNIPGTAKFMNNSFDELYSMPLLEIIKSIFWIYKDINAPLAYHLWFLRDLIIMVAIAPLLFIYLQKTKWFGVIILYVLSIYEFSILGLLYPVIPTSLFSSLLWFSFGGVLLMTSFNPAIINIKAGVSIFVMFLGLSFFEQLYQLKLYDGVNKLIVLSGVFGVWFSYDAVIKRVFTVKVYNNLLTVCSYTLFIYLFHEPSINVVRKIIVFMIGKTSYGYLISYLVSPLIFAVLAIVAASIIRSKNMVIYKNLVGGRS